MASIDCLSRREPTLEQARRAARAALRIKGCNGSGVLRKTGLDWENGAEEALAGAEVS
jgi:hypothetical protein